MTKSDIKNSRRAMSLLEHLAKAFPKLSWVKPDCEFIADHIENIEIKLAMLEQADRLTGLLEKLKTILALERDADPDVFTVKDLIFELETAIKSTETQTP